MAIIELDLDKLQESGLFVEEYVVLQLIHSGLNPDSFKVSSKEIIPILEQNLWIKSVEDGWELRSKALSLFQNKDTRIDFEVFWKNYHEITGLPKTDREAAQKYWKKLTNKETIQANSNIENYYNSLKDKKYCKKARTYLADKNFNDEFIVTTKDWTVRRV